MRPEDERYFGRLESQLDDAIAVANEARTRGGDPTLEVEIPVAKDMADRVENILGIDGVAARVRELEGEMSREEAALELVTDFVEGTVGDYDTRAGKVEGAVRTAVALLTEGVVAAPIEGIDRVELLQNDDGTEFVNVYYAGPIRSAGGTAQALSVLVADYARSLLGVEEFSPRADEVERYAEEVALYDKETGLQYAPSDPETRFIAEHVPIMLDGEATGDEEVSGFRDLERVGTNSARGGMCLVLAEGIALKAPKIQRYTRQLDEVDWPWLQDLIDGTYDDAGHGSSDASRTAGGDANDELAPDARADGDDSDDVDDSAASGGPGAAHEEGQSDPGRGDGEKPGPPRVDSSSKYLRDLIAGRPVFGHPSESGGFRLRYGRARNHGFATAGVHPATMHLVDDFLATGTQIKTERPGKAAGVVPVDSIEGPTVKLANGDVRRIDDPAEALAVRNGVVSILDLGEYLVNYGEFVENNHALAPASYTVEWWAQDLAAAGADVQALRDDPGVDLADPDARRALAWAEKYDAPLHPAYTYLWHDLPVDRFEALADAVGDARFAAADGAAVESPTTPDDEHTLVLPRSDAVCEALETLLVEHEQGEETVTVADALPLVRSLGFTETLDRTWESLSPRARSWDGGANSHPAVCEVAPFDLQERAPTRIGNRMGRPEKSETRELSPAVHTLFPIGEAGGSQRDVAAAATQRDATGRPGEVRVEVGRRQCTDCGARTFRPRCPDCRGQTAPHFECPDCEIEATPDESGRAECPRCGGTARSTEVREVDVGEEYREALANVGERPGTVDMVKGVKGLTSTHKVPEPMEKGVLRAKNGVSAFKDGTVRYDMTDLPVTAVRAAELDVDVDQLRTLGYTHDVDGDPLEHDDQLVELKVQDVVLSDGAAEHMLRTADYVDDLLERYYGLESFYDVDDRQELIGELVFGMAPHTSAAVIGRVVGFTSAAVGYAHPYFHASKRRNCFHPETKVWYRDEAEQWHYEAIRTMVEARLDPEVAEEDDFGALVQQLDGDVFVPSIGDDGMQRLKPVEAVSKHPAPEHMIRLQTRSGRELTVTPDHRVHVHDPAIGRITSAEARELDESDYLITPRNLHSVVQTSSDYRFDLLAEFINSSTVETERLMVKGLDKETLYNLFTDRLAPRWDGPFYPLQSTAEHLGLTKKALSNYLYRESIPVSLLEKFFETTDDMLAFIPESVTLGIKRDAAEIDRFIELNARVATLLGYYASEGFAREQETPKGTIHQTTICGTETESREFFLDALREEFSTSPYEENPAKVTVSGRLLRTFVDTVLDAGVFAHTKRVPQCLFDASDEVVAAYLRGYFSGDGCISRGSTVISASTVSRELKEDLLALLTRLGIDTQVRHLDPVLLREKFPDFYDREDESMTRPGFVISISGHDSERFAERVGFHLTRKDETLHIGVENSTPRGEFARCFDGGTEEYLLDPLDTVEHTAADSENVYCLTVEDSHSLIADDISVRQCDGDEDCIMLLLDGLLNFSKQYLPSSRGGRMDAPLVMSSRIDPSEIDDEAHNMDVVDRYPREFYEATREMAPPESVDVTIAEEFVGTDREYTGFRHTHDTSNLALGPDLSAYKTLGSMMDKMDAQLELARKLRAVDETDVAERVIEYHFLPDLIGNLRAFSRQETRCLDCGEKYRRMPLTGDCRECGGRVNLTVHQGSVNKYMDAAKRVAEEYGCREYTKQRLEILERSLDSVFENDKNRASSLSDFM